MIETIIHAFSSIAWAIFVVMTVAQVFLRYVAGTPLFWTEELARLCLVWFVYLGAIILTKEDDHIRVGIFVDKVSGRWKYLFKLIKNFAEISVAAYLIYGSWVILPVTIKTRTPALDIPVAFWYAAATTGAVVILFVALKKGFLNLKSFIRNI